MIQSIASTYGMGDAFVTGNNGAIAYARRLAYLKDPERIRRETIREYGTAPSVATIKRFVELREKAQQPKTLKGQTRGYSEATDTGQWTPRAVGIKPAPILTPANKREPVQPGRNAQSVMENVCRYFGMEADEVRHSSRKTKDVMIRALTARLLRDRRNKTGGHRYTLNVIAKVIGRKDHSTVMNAIRRFDHFAAQYPELQEAYEALKDG